MLRFESIDVRTSLKAQEWSEHGQRACVGLGHTGVIGVAVKGRASSLQLRNALLVFNLLTLGTSCYSYFCYIQRSLISADKPSRWGYRKSEL
eukprot:11303398-Karenia_brevis.AAC.1